jgi:hypothetical protein
LYERSEDLLRLAIRMQGAAAGVSLADIEDMFGVARQPKRVRRWCWSPRTTAPGRGKG